MSYCSPQLQSLEILVVVYVIALSVLTMVFAVFNMNISSQFGAEGKVTAAAILVVLCIGWMDVLIRVSFDSSDSPNVFRWEFYWSVVYTFSTVLITSGFLYIPLVSCCIWLIYMCTLTSPSTPSFRACVCVCVHPQYYHMYKEHQFNSTPSEKGDSQETSQRLEHYHHLRSQATDLRQQLDEVCGTVHNTSTMLSILGEWE